MPVSAKPSILDSYARQRYSTKLIMRSRALDVSQDFLEKLQEGVQQATNLDVIVESFLEGLKAEGLPTDITALEKDGILDKWIVEVYEECLECQVIRKKRKDLEAILRNALKKRFEKMISNKNGMAESDVENLRSILEMMEDDEESVVEFYTSFALQAIPFDEERESGRKTAASAKAATQVEEKSSKGQEDDTNPVELNELALSSGGKSNQGNAVGSVVDGNSDKQLQDRA